MIRSLLDKIWASAPVREAAPADRGVHGAPVAKVSNTETEEGPKTKEEHASKRSSKRKDARKILYSLFDERYNADRRQSLLLGEGEILSHAGHIVSGQDLEDRPTFFSRLEDDKRFYLDRYEGASLCNMRTLKPLLLVDMGGLDMDGDKRMQEFSAALPLFSSYVGDNDLNDFERNKNLAMLEWVGLKRDDGFRIDGWWRGTPRESEEILIIQPKGSLEYVGNQSRAEFIAHYEARQGRKSSRATSSLER